MNRELSASDRTSADYVPAVVAKCQPAEWNQPAEPWNQAAVVENLPVEEENQPAEAERQLVEAVVARNRHDVADAVVVAAAVSAAVSAAAGVVQNQLDDVVLENQFPI